MKLWTLDFNQEDTPSGWVFEWFPNKAQAMARYKELNADLEGHGVTNLKLPERIEVPKDKAGLIRFLNKYAANGV